VLSTPKALTLESPCNLNKTLFCLDSHEKHCGNNHALKKNSQLITKQLTTSFDRHPMMTSIKMSKHRSRPTRGNEIRIKVTPKPQTSYALVFSIEINERKFGDVYCQSHLNMYIERVVTESRMFFDCVRQAVKL
jgi:uncharacterized membrane protein